MNWTNERNNHCTSSFRPGDRYQYDSTLLSDGFQQYDTTQDASYFGVWVHIERRTILTYAEGDVTVVQCDNDQTLKAELDHMAAFYGEPPPAFTGIAADGSITKFYDTRPQVGDAPLQTPNPGGPHETESGTEERFGHSRRGFD